MLILTFSENVMYLVIVGLKVTSKTKIEFAENRFYVKIPVLPKFFFFTFPGVLKNLREF